MYVHIITCCWISLNPKPSLSLSLSLSTEGLGMRLVGGFTRWNGGRKESTNTSGLTY